MEYQSDNSLKFIIGHEYAHHYLGHLSERKLISINAFDTYKIEVYSNKHDYEFDADYEAIINVNDKNEKDALATGAFNFFLWLDLYKTVEEYLFPPTSLWTSHPEPIKRLWKLRNRLNKEIGPSDDDIQNIVDNYTSLKEHLINEFLPFEVDQLESYGAIYLPNYKDRSKIDMDRFDF